MSSSECVLLMLVVTVVETGDDPAGAKTESQESDTHFPSKILELELELSMHLLHALPVKRRGAISVRTPASD